jgi:hypothetical protein
MIHNPSRRPELVREISATPLETWTLSRARIRVRVEPPQEGTAGVFPGVRKFPAEGVL